MPSFFFALFRYLPGLKFPLMKKIMLHPLLAKDHLHPLHLHLVWLHKCLQYFCFIMIIAGTLNTLNAENDAASNTGNNWSASNTCIQFCCMYACINCCCYNTALKTLCIRATILHPILVNCMSASNIIEKFAIHFSSCTKCILF